MNKLKKPRKKKRRGHYHRGVHVSPKCDHECHYRSGWELSYLQYLDTDPTVKAYHYEKLKIPYVANVRSGRTRNYIPDVFIEYVDGSFALVEIKPKRKLTQPTVVKKLKAAQAWVDALGVTLVIITEVELKLLGLLK